MTYNSVLFNTTDFNTVQEIEDPPDFFSDLNLDQIIDAVTVGKAEYELKPLFYTPVFKVDTIHYRHEIVRDMENKKLLGFIRTFAGGMSTVRRYLVLVEKLYYPYHKEGWILKTVDLYCKIIDQFSEDMSRLSLDSRGLRQFTEYLQIYTASDSFRTMKDQTNKLKERLGEVHYSLFIKENHIRVQRYNGEQDYSREVEETFKKFKQSSVRDYTAEFTSKQTMDHIEAEILDMVAKLYPETFMELDRYTDRYADFQNIGIKTFDREIQFFLAYLDYTACFTYTGLPFCYPDVSRKTKEVFCRGGYDLALAQNLLHREEDVVCNDFFMKGPERVIVVSGPNQGGKTTFARMFGQLHYLAALGCPVPGREAQLYQYDTLFTHFEKEEDITNLRSKLEDDLIRIHDILWQATSDSIIIMNEIFNSTTLYDALSIGTKVLNMISDMDVLCLLVTFVDEFSTFNNKTVSMVSTIIPDNPAVRTYRIVREKADGLAYALTIAEKYDLSYKRLRERLKI